VTRYSTVDDVGQVVNPMIVEGQTLGGIVQGIGQGAGEGGIAPVTAAVTSAICDALAGIEFSDVPMPITAQKLWSVMHRGRTQQSFSRG